MQTDWNAKLFNYGYLLTNDHIEKKTIPDLEWDHWKSSAIGEYSLYVHEKESFYYFDAGIRAFLLIGHAYNPFTMDADENSILRQLAGLFGKDEEYWDYFDQLTGLFAYFVIQKDTVHAACDCAGMMGAYYGLVNGKQYFSAHAQMIAEIAHLQEDRLVTKLKQSRTFHLYGLYLPGDLSPYAEVKRILPNVEVQIKQGVVRLNRFYPRKEYRIEDDYAQRVRKIGELLHNNMVLISSKWQKPSISLTGGTDSKTTLACASTVQDKFDYFSYVSLPREATDADAARRICESLRLKHNTISVDPDPESYADFSEVDALIERHYGYLGKANANDVCKRITLSDELETDIEVKSWVSEVARASRYEKYAKKSLPERMTPRMLTSMYKVFTIDRGNALRTDRVFKEYIVNTQLDQTLSETKYPWSEFFVWEIVFGGWGGLTLSCEHKISNNITVPYNNRAILDLMLRTPLEKRRTDQLHRDIMDAMDPRINTLGIHVVNGNETELRKHLEGLYFDVHSHIPF